MPPWVSSVLHEMDFFILLKQNWVEKKGEICKVYGKYNVIRNGHEDKQKAVKDDGGWWWILVLFLKYKTRASKIIIVWFSNPKIYMKYKWKDLYSSLIQYFKYDVVISFAWIIPLFFSVQRRLYLPLILFVFHFLNAIVISYFVVAYK